MNQVTSSGSEKMQCKTVKVVSSALLILALILGVSMVGLGREKLIVIGHRVHRTTAQGEEGTGRNLVEEFEKKYNVDVVYQTFPTTQIQEKLFRLGPLSRCEEDIIHINSPWAVKRLTKFLEPLDKYLKTKPIEGFPEDWPPATVNNYTIEGSLYAMPVRTGFGGLWYNKKIFAERGIPWPPRTPEELYETAAKCTYEKPSGEKVFGFCMRGVTWEIHEGLVCLARWWGGDFITPDYRVTCNEPPAIKALELLRRMYQEGIMPPNWTSIDFAENMKLFQEGRAAIVRGATSYGQIYNDPKQSKIAGYAAVTTDPLARELWTPERNFGVDMVFAWAQGIFQGSDQKDLAWEFIRFLASEEAQIEMAKSGNAPARTSVWQAKTKSDHPAYDPGAWAGTAIAPYTRFPLPPIEKITEVIDVIGTRTQNVVVHGRPAQAEMDLLAKELEDLIR